MKSLVLSLCLFAGVGLAQTNTCQFSFNFNQKTGFTFQPQPTPFDNRLKGCNFFTLNYQATGLSAVSVELDSASGAQTAGSFAAYSGTVSTGVNPSTNTTGTQATFKGYVGWLRVLVAGTPTGSTWTITGTVYGSLTGGSGSGSSTPVECLQPHAGSCYVQGGDATATPPLANPIATGNFDGTNVASDFSCIFQAVTFVAPGTTAKIITNTGTGKRIKICHIHETSGSTSANITIRSGTSLQCAAGTTSIDGLIGTSGFVFDYGPKSSLKAANANDDVCMDFSVSITATILVIYAEI